MFTRIKLNETSRQTNTCERIIETLYPHVVMLTLVKKKLVDLLKPTHATKTPVRHWEVHVPPFVPQGWYESLLFQKVH